MLDLVSELACVANDEHGLLGRVDLLRFCMLDAPTKTFASSTEPNSRKSTSSKYDGSSYETISKSA